MECDLCVKPFDKSLREPYVLIPCSHTYCHSCIQRLNLKQCKSCNQQINAINKNWILIKLIPESSYDRLKANTVSLLEETNNLGKQYDEIRLKNFKQNTTRISGFTDEIEIRYRELCERLHADYESLISEMRHIEENINKEYCDYSYKNEKLVKNFAEFERKLNLNELDEAQLKELFDELGQIKLNLNENIGKQNELENFSFNNNKKVLLEKNLIGEILNKS